MRIVITGGPSVGKTTLITLLQKRGYPVIEEQATKTIKEGKYLPWEDRNAFQQEVLRRQIDEESRLNDEGRVVFLDRGVFDGEAYFIYDDLFVPTAFSRLNADRYDLAFLVEELPFFETNDVRRENIEFTREISNILERCYIKRGVPVVRVPFMTPEERVNFVISETRKLVPSVTVMYADGQKSMPMSAMMGEALVNLA
jgi:predicted ATPase